MMHEKLAFTKYPSKLLVHAGRNFARMAATSTFAAATRHYSFGSSRCAIFRISEHARTSEHVEAPRVGSACCLDRRPDPTLEGLFRVYLLAVPKMRTAFSPHGGLAGKGK